MNDEEQSRGKNIHNATSFFLMSSSSLLECGLKIKTVSRLQPRFASLFVCNNSSKKCIYCLIMPFRNNLKLNNTPLLKEMRSKYMLEREGEEHIEDVQCLPQKLVMSSFHSREGVDKTKRTEQGNKSNLDETMHECLCTEIVSHCD